MKTKIFLITLFFLILGISFNSSVSADGYDPIFLDVCVKPDRRGEMRGGFLFGITADMGVYDPYAYGKVVSFKFEGVKSPIYTDFGLEEYTDKYTYVIPYGFEAQWAEKSFPLLDSQQSISMTLSEIGSNDSVTWIINIPSIKEANAMMLLGTANPCPSTLK